MNTDRDQQRRRKAVQGRAAVVMVMCMRAGRADGIYKMIDCPDKRESRADPESRGEPSLLTCRLRDNPEQRYYDEHHAACYEYFVREFGDFGQTRTGYDTAGGQQEDKKNARKAQLPL